MKNHRLLLITIGFVALLFTASLTYFILNDGDTYNYHSGLGEAIAVSPDDASLAFSYYENGREAIYRGNIKDGSVEKVTDPVDRDHRLPQFSPDGKGLLYLAAANDGVQTLHYTKDGTSAESRRLSGADAHVADAVFSPDGRTIYYIAIPAEDFLKPEGEKENGADLFAVNIASGDFLKLTDKDAFAMEGLAISADGTTLYYTEFDGVQRLMAYSIEDKTDRAYLQEYIRGDLYQPAFSQGNEWLAYTTVSEESSNSGSTFEYELFLMETSIGETKRVTELHASVTSPAFFHQANRLAFLTQPNWPAEPAVFEAMTVDYNSGEIRPLQLDLPETSNGFRPSVIVYWFTNPLTITGLYLLLFGLLTSYSQLMWNKVYLPAKISAILTGMVVAGSFAAAVFNPWAAIALFTLAAGLAGCTIIIFFFAYSYRRIEKSSKRNPQETPASK